MCTPTSFRKARTTPRTKKEDLSIMQMMILSRKQQQHETLGKETMPKMPQLLLKRSSSLTTGSFSSESRNLAPSSTTRNDGSNLWWEKNTSRTIGDLEDDDDDDVMDGEMHMALPNSKAPGYQCHLSEMIKQTHMRY